MDSITPSTRACGCRRVVHVHGSNPLRRQRIVEILPCKTHLTVDRAGKPVKMRVDLLKLKEMEWTLQLFNEGWQPEVLQKTEEEL